MMAAEHIGKAMAAQTVGPPLARVAPHDPRRPYRRYRQSTAACNSPSRRLACCRLGAGGGVCLRWSDIGGNEMAYLLVTSGPSAGTSFDLTKCPVSIGQDATQDIRLRDRHVSRKHLDIDRNGDETYTVKAQPKAKNGMLVNDNAAGDAVLANGDRIRVGQTEILFLATDQSSQVEAIKRVRVWSSTPIAKTTRRPRAKAK
jgi:hypothetical protein